MFCVCASFSILYERLLDRQQPSAHTVSGLSVEVNGDSAIAYGYSQIFLREDDSFRVLRVAHNRWDLARHDGQWLIDRRESRLVGEEQTQDLLKEQFS